MTKKKNYKIIFRHAINEFQKLYLKVSSLIRDIISTTPLGVIIID